MKNSIQALIREAFNTAYSTHRSTKNSMIIKESSERLGALLSPEEKAKADAVLNTMVSQGPGWEKYQWDPSGKVNGVSQAEWNYIIEKILELYQATGEEKYKNIIGNAYTFGRKTTGIGDEAVTTNSALYNSIAPSLKANTALERLEQRYPDFLYEALSRAWGRLFAGGKIDPTSGKYSGQKGVDAWKKLVDDYVSSGKSNFGAYLREVIFNDVRYMIKTEADKAMASLDKPTKTGKPGDIGDDEGEDGIEDIRTGDEFGDEENIEGGDVASTGYEAVPAGDDYVQQKQDRAAQRVANFQKAIQNIVHASKTMGIKNEAGLLALKEIVFNFLDYEEIARKYPEIFQAKEKSDTNVVNSILKNKNLIKISNEVLSKYIPVSEAKDLGLYSIFSEPNWQEKYKIGPEVVDEIIERFKKDVSASTTLKNQYMFVFREYALNHLSPEEIADKLSSVEKKAYKTKEKTGAAALVQSALYNLGKNVKFSVLADSILRENGFNIDFEDINWSDWAKAGKALQAAEKAEEPTADVVGDEEGDRYVWENFLSENMDKIMERVYKKLVRFL